MELIVVFDQVLILVQLRLVIGPVYLIECRAGGLLSLVGVEVGHLHSQEVRVVLLLYLGRRPRIFAIRILYALLASIEHIVLVRLRLPSPDLRVPLLRRLLLTLPCARWPLFLALPVPMRILHLLYLCHKLLPKLIILILIEHLDLGSQRFKVLHEC